jgi:hypothetical protein
MSLQFWIILWKAVFIGGIVLFAVMAVGVSIGGIRDIGKLLHTLREQADNTQAGSPPNEQEPRDSYPDK